MNIIYGAKQFDNQMRKFKGRGKVVVASQPDKAYFMTGSDQRFGFLDYSEYDPSVLGRPAEFYQNIIIEHFFRHRAKRGLYYTEAWRSDPDKEYYIRMKSASNGGQTGVFEVWSYYDVATIEVTFIPNPMGCLPKLIKVKSLEHVSHYEDEE